MTIIVALACLLIGINLGIAGGLWLEHASGKDILKHCWQQIADLQARNQALTESLCRAEGKPFVPAGKQALEPSEGWFDGADVVRKPD